MLTHADVLRLIHYDPETGVVTRLQDKNAGTPVKVRSGEYGQLQLVGKRYWLHRLIWFYMTGEWPKYVIDHINGKRDDNRWANLRDVTQQQNTANRQGPNVNNRLKVKGVHLLPSGRYRAQIWSGGKPRHLGCFDTIEQAEAAVVGVLV